ncbi:sensor domain-containing diguanylate cyclase [Pseudomonas sp. LRF_L74]|uniref:sensor domain-containing diguanylate cyclase n=1 Tax=Pseudomonas sp. LRF_L74 TaxID=3369422 RepID=UPI003F6099E3
MPVAIVGWLSWAAYGVQLRESQIETANLASALARQAGDTLKKADTVLIDLTERVRVDGQMEAQRDRLQRLMQTYVSEQAELQGLFVYDAQGEWLVTSFGKIPPGANNADREYFIYHRNDPDDRAPHVGPPIRSRTTGQWVIPLSRRLEDAQGRFAGVILATISIDYFRNFYATFDVRRNGSISLVRSSGEILVRMPFDERQIGMDLSKGVIFRQLLPNSPVGNVILPSQIDGMVRLCSYRALQHYPLIVVTALARDDVLAKWWRDSIVQLLVVVALCATLGLAGFYLIRLIKHGQQAQAELLATRDALCNSNTRLEQLALEDDLTRLANRRRFMQALHDEFARAYRTQRPMALVILDVDHFKQYNDIYGHANGDDCLQQVAQVIRSAQKRPGDLAARYGGEEFCLLLPETDLPGARQVAERVLTDLAARNIDHAGSPLRRVSLSAGVYASVPDDCLDPQGVIRKADAALYAAKAAGRNQVCSQAD